MTIYRRRISRGFYALESDQAPRNVDVTQELTYLRQILAEFKKIEPVTDPVTGQLKLVYPVSP